MYMEKFNIEEIMNLLKKKRKIYISEADFQLEMAMAIKEKYKEKVKVRLEFCPIKFPRMHIDILVIIDGLWIPIELKYKTKKYENEITYEDGTKEFFALKEHKAINLNSYKYLKDIERIEKVRKKEPTLFREGYTVFITNDLRYREKPKEGCMYEMFSLHDRKKEEFIENKKIGKLEWIGKPSKSTVKDCGEPIHLNKEYTFVWKDYSQVDDSKTGSFIYLVNKIEK